MMRLIKKEASHSFIKKFYDNEAKMDPTYLLVLIFVPVPVTLLYALIVDINDRKKKSKASINHLQSNKIPNKFPGPEKQKIGQPSAS